MFEIESKKPEIITIRTASKVINLNYVEGVIEAGLSVGEITGPGEYEIGEAAIRAIGVPSGKTIYDVVISGVHVGVIGDTEEGLDDLGIADVLCTSSVRAVRETGPKLVIATGNVDGMVTDLKLTARTEKKIKIKSTDSLPAAAEVVVLN